MRQGAPVDLQAALQRLLEASTSLQQGHDPGVSDEEVVVLESVLVHPDLKNAPKDIRAGILNFLGIVRRGRYDYLGQRTDLDRAIEIFRAASDLQARETMPLAGHLGNLGNALRTRYRTWGERNDLDQAIDVYQHAVSLIRSASHLTNLGTALIDRYDATSNSNDFEEALKTFKEAVGKAPLRERPLCLNNLGNALLSRYRRFGGLPDLSIAIDSFREAVDQTPYGTSARAFRLASLGIGLQARFEHFSDLSDLEESINVLRQSIDGTPSDSPESPRRQRSLAAALRGRYSFLGHASDLEDAIDAVRQALEHVQQESPERPKFLNDLGAGLQDRYARSNDPADLDLAIRYYQSAVDGSSQSAAERHLYLNQLGVGLRIRHKHHGELADLERAIVTLQKAVDLVRSAPAQLPMYLLNLGTALEDRYDLKHDMGDLAAAIDHYKQAVDQVPSPPELALSLNNFGFASLKRYAATRERADLASIVHAFESAVEMTSSNSPMYPLYLGHLGRALLERHRALDDAASLNASIDAGERSRSFLESAFNVLPLDYKLGQQRETSDVGAWLVAAYLRRAAVNTDTAVADRSRAMVVAEATKSRVLTELLGRQSLPSPPNVPPELVARESNLLQELTAIDSTVLAARGDAARQLKSSREALTFKMREAKRQELVRVWQEIEQYGDQAREYAALRRGDPLTSDNMAALVSELGSDTALVSLFTTGTCTCLFILRSGWNGPAVVENPISDTEWSEIGDRVIRELHAYSGKADELETWADRLYPLLEQAACHLKNLNRIVFVPEGAGHLLPWAVVYSRIGLKGRDRLSPSIVTLPALALLPRLRRRATEGEHMPLVVGNATDDLEGSELEANAVAKILKTEALLRSDATRQTVLERLAHASIIHLACHASFRRGSPLDSDILLADGVLTARDILAYRMHACDLLVLSGCETGLADALAGDELAGLAQSFFHAGARSVVVSLWRVDDLATATLMRAFYSARQSGDDKGSALTRAMAEVRADKRWAHPYFWGAFVMMGDWD